MPSPDRWRYSDEMRLHLIDPRDEPRAWTDREFTVHGRVNVLIGYAAGIATWLLVQGISRMIESWL